MRDQEQDARKARVAAAGVGLVGMAISALLSALRIASRRPAEAVEPQGR